MSEVPNSISIPAPADSSTAPVVAPAATAEGERPEGLPEKFWNAETKTADYAALAKSYVELEKGKPAQTPEEKEAADKAAAAEADPDAAAKAAAEAAAAEGGQFAEYFTEFAEKGEVSPESREALGKLGITSDMVDQYIKGAKADATDAAGEITKEIGGVERFNTVATWAKDEPAVAAVVAAFNAASKEGRTVEAKLALASLNTAYTKANGKPATARINGAAASSAGIGYASLAEQQADIENPQYRTDPAFRDKVAARIAVSTY